MLAIYEAKNFVITCQSLKSINYRKKQELKFGVLHAGVDFCLTTILFVVTYIHMRCCEL